MPYEIYRLKIIRPCPFPFAELCRPLASTRTFGGTERAVLVSRRMPWGVSADFRSVHWQRLLANDTAKYNLEQTLPLQSELLGEQIEGQTLQNTGRGIENQMLTYNLSTTLP